MHRRLVVTAALGAVLTLSSGAGAAPRSCLLVKDPRGDMSTTAGVAGDDDLDILSADVATDRTNVTAAVRTVSMRGATSPDSPAGRAWEVWFTTGEDTYIMVARALANGYDGIVYRSHDTTDVGLTVNNGTAIGPARVTFDTARKEVRITAPLKHFAPFTAIIRGRVLRNLQARAFKMYGHGPVNQSTPAGYDVQVAGDGSRIGQDAASSTRTYNPGTPSCVPVGK